MFVVLLTQFKSSVAEFRGFVFVLFEMGNKASVRDVVTRSTLSRKGRMFAFQWRDYDHKV